MQESKQEVTEVVSLVKIARKGPSVSNSHNRCCKCVVLWCIVLLLQGDRDVDFTINCSGHTAFLNVTFRSSKFIKQLSIKTT